MAGQLVASKREINDWKNRIELAWQKSVASVIEVGSLIKAAKAKLGISFAMLEVELPFSSSVAAYLVKIAENPVLSNPRYFNKLPNGYNTLYYLSSVEDGLLQEKIERGEITPDFSLASAKSLREVAPKSPASGKPRTKVQSFEVGTISVPVLKNLDAFEHDLASLLEKYGATITLTKKSTSLAEWHKSQLLKQAKEKISKCEAELGELSLEQMRMLEDAAHFLTKEKNQKNKVEVVVNDEIVLRAGIPQDYKDYKELVRLLGREEITRGYLKTWCIERKIPNQFTELTSMDKELYVWEQVRLVTEKKNVKAGLKRLYDLSTRSRIPKIKSLAQKLYAELTRFDNKN